MLEKRAKGLCFTCNEKLSPNHICSRKELSLLVVSEDGEGDVVEVTEKLEPETEVEENSMADISLSSVVGHTNQNHETKGNY